MDLTRAEIESLRIREGRCPACGGAIKDKGSYLRCCKCSWQLTCGSYNQEAGYVVMYDPDGGDPDARPTHPECL